MNCRPYSTPPTGRTSWWRKLVTFGAALALFGGTASAQCTNPNSYSGTPAPANFSSISYAGCTYTVEFNTITGVTAGNGYTFELDFTIGGGNATYCTVREGSPTGPSIGSGTLPLTVVSTNGTDLYPHWTLDGTCAGEASCNYPKITNNGPSVACSGTPTAGTVPASFTNCANTPVAITVTGATAASGITFAWEESDDNNVGDPWAPVVGGSGAATATYTTAGFVGTRYYRCTVTCTNSSLSAVTGSCQVNQNAACQFTIARNTGVTYTSIFGTGESNYVFSNVSTDDGATAATSIAGTTFTYKGVTVTDFRAGTNGWMTFNAGFAPTSYFNTIGAGSGTNPAALCPLYDDLICSPNDFSAISMDNCMRYKIIGTLGSGTAQIIAEWREMDNFAAPSTSMNFQVILNELGNTITFRYGRTEGFTGGQNPPWSYSLGLTAWSYGTPGSYTDVLAMRDENTTNFDFSPATAANTGLNGNVRVPSCFSEYVFTPAAAYPGPGAAPSAAPGNDEIAGAELLPVNPALCGAGDLCNLYRTSQFATATAGIPVCSAVIPGTPDDDVWFKFNANASSTSVRVISGTNNDCVVQLLDATGTTALFCVNLSGLGAIETLNATGLTPGQDYLVRVYDAALGTNASTRGDFAICVAATPLPPTNDDCSGATVLTPAIGCLPVPGNSFTANPSANPVCTGQADDDVWYSFVAPGTGAIVRVQSIGSYNAALQVFSSVTNDCNDLVSIPGACLNSTVAGGLEQATLTTLTPGSTYFVRVYHAIGGAANGQFTICVDAGAQCPVLSAPADNATVVTLPIAFSWTGGLFATGYDVYFDQNNPPTTLVSSNQPGLSYNAPGPFTNGVYFWRVEARNGLGATTTCAQRTLNVAIPSCIQPSQIAVVPTSVSGATVSWLCGTCVGTYIVEYGAPGFVPGTGATAGAGTIVSSASLSAALGGLTANTLYDVYVRQECLPFVDYSVNTGPFSYRAPENLCAANFYDNGGPAGPPLISPTTEVRTFCPTNPGDQVSASFNSFDLFASWDALYVFNGPSTASTKIASANGLPATNPVFGTGGYWGNALPGPFISTDPSGCLTFAYSSSTINWGNPGWNASIACNTPPACTVPTGVTATAVSGTSATISWSCVACTGTGPFLLEYGISGFTPGTGSTAGVGGTVITPATSPVVLTGLLSNVTYRAYVRQDCNGLNTTFSPNSLAPATFTTAPGCGSTYNDLGGVGNYPAGINGTAGQTLLCPTNPTDKVIVTFTSFRTEPSWDPLYVFDGPTTASPKIASVNGVPNTSPNLGTGGWWANVSPPTSAGALALAPTNTGLPGVVLSTHPSGCLTMVHISDGSVQYEGWTANVGCASPQYTCATAGPINCNEQKTGFTLGGTNTLPVNGCAFNGGASTSGVSWWTYSALATGDISLSTCALTTMNTRISVYKPMPDCNNLVCVGAVDDNFGCPNGTSTMRFRANAGQLYYIAVHGNAANNGVFQLQLFCDVVCAADPNDNDNCGSATPITCQLQDGLQVLTNDDNSCSFVDGPTSCSSTNPAVGNWYSFTTVGNANYRTYVVDNSIDPLKTGKVMQFALYSGSCTDLLATGPVSCDNTGAGFTNLPPLSPFTPYKLFVYNDGSVSNIGSFGVWVDNPALYDADVTAVTNPTGIICNLTTSPVVTLQNNGEATLTSSVLEVSFDGGPGVTTYPWTGSLAPGASTTVTLNAMNILAGAHSITVTATNPNGFADQIPANDGASVSYNATGQTVVVSVKTGSVGAQCSWQVLDAFFFPLGSGGPYTGQNNQTITTSVCLETTLGNCFYFILYDQLGDGLQNASNWELRDAQSKLILSDNGAFTGQSPSTAPLSTSYNAHVFCLPLGPSPIQVAECNVFSNYLNNKVYTTAVSGATNYLFEFSDPNAGFYRRIVLPRNWVKFGEMVTSPLTFGTKYFCRAKADQGAFGFDDDFYGAGCEMALAAMQPVCTELISTPGSTFSCGVTKTFGGSAKIWAQPVSYATQYRFSFVGLIDPDGPNPNLVTDVLGTPMFNDPPALGTRNIVRTSYVCPLNWASYQLVSGQTYQVSVEVFVGGVWSGFCGAVCPVAILNPPSQGGRIATETEYSSISLWPNPVRDGRVNLVIRDLVDATQMITVDVYDVFGKRVMAQHYENAGEVFNQVLDLDANLAAGNYTVNITVNDELYVERLNVVR